MTDPDDEIFEAEIAAALRTIPVLTRNEEDELVRVATSNSAEADQALHELERASIRLVLSIARNETNGRPLRHCYELGRRGWTEALGQFDRRYRLQILNLLNVAHSKVHPSGRRRQATTAFKPLICKLIIYNQCA